MITEHEYIRQLYMEKLAGIISTADETILQQLLAKNESNKAFWQSLVAEGEQIKVADFISNTDEHAALKNLKQQLPQRKIHLWKYAAAAAVLIIVSSGLWINLSQKNTVSPPLANKKEVQLNHSAIQLQLENGEVLTLNKEDKNGLVNIADINVRTSDKGIEAIDGGNANAQTTLYVPAKQDYQITLSDGTKVWLNSTSKLQFPIRFSNALREIHIDGEAYLEVAKDAKRPFIVHTKNTDIRVLGTKFNINTYNENIVKTSLVEGSVLLTSNNKSTKLIPRQQGVYTTDQGFLVSNFDQELALSWIIGTYYFQNNSLKEIAQIIKRWFDVEVVFENPQLVNFRLSGMLEKQQLSAFLKDLEGSSEVKTKLVGNKLYFR